MKKNSFVEGAVIATVGIILVKIIGLIYVIPFNAIIGEHGGALYGYGYNVYQLFLSISTAIAFSAPNIKDTIDKIPLPQPTSSTL